MNIQTAAALLLSIIASGLLFLSVDLWRDHKNNVKAKKRMDFVENLLSEIFSKKEILALTLCLFLFSCSSSKHYQKIHGLTKSGNVQADIKKKSGDTVTLKNIAGVYVLKNDTLTRIK